LTKTCLFEAKPKKPRKPRAKKVDSFLASSLVRAPGRIELTLPIKTLSEANKFEHWQARAKRQKIYLDLIRLAMGPILSEIRLPCVITCKRYGVRLLDAWDNLPMSFKKIVDLVAELLTGKGRGRGDGDPRLSWRYDQEKSKAYGIRITFEF